jgi:hypothetical protein
MTNESLVAHGAVLLAAALQALVGVVALVGVAALVATVRGVFDMPLLARVNVTRRETWPRVSVVVPACDEQESVEAPSAPRMAWIVLPALGSHVVNAAAAGRSRATQTLRAASPAGRVDRSTTSAFSLGGRRRFIPRRP